MRYSPQESMEDVMNKYVKWGLVGLLVFYLVTQPAAAAGLVHGAFGFLHDTATGVGTFVTNVGPSDSATP